MDNKITIFLGCEININNAQSLNCLNIARYINHNKFNIITVINSTKNMDILNEKFIKNIDIKTTDINTNIEELFKECIIKSDICYFPTRKYNESNSLSICKKYNKPSMITIESILNDEALIKFNDLEKIEFINRINLFDHIYSITKFIQKKEFINYKIDSKYLPLGLPDFLLNENTNIKKKKITDVVFIGHNTIRKRLNEFISLSKYFPDINFHIIGEKGVSIDNLIYQGKLDQYKLKYFFKNIDINILPSRTEGFPKTIIECALNNIPSIVMDSYGAFEWIDNNQTGFIVSSLDGMKDKLNYLVNNEQHLYDVKKNCLQLGKKFLLKDNIIKLWEKEFETIYSNANKNLNL